MRQEAGNKKQEVAGRGAPVRGTQTFVGVMAWVWGRPGLTAIEIGWRWALGSVVLSSLWLAFGASTMAHWGEYQATWQIAMHGGFIFGIQWSLVLRDAMLSAALGSIWACVSAYGRLAVMRRLDGSLNGRWSTVAQLYVLRVWCLGAIWWAWLLGVLAIANWTVWTPMQRGGEPNYVPGFACVLLLTLVLFVTWALVSWVLQLAPILAMAQGLSALQSLRAALKAGTVRGKLIEINFVMGIVKIALIVLAMVLSASPLPFTNVATQAFLTCWWVGVGLLYFAMSDYFHVVRVAAYLRLWRVYEKMPVA